jgi:hypothetical protein
MNKYLLALAVLCVSGFAHAFPLVFEESYENNAWGYQNQGCVIDEARYVYRYNVAKEEPMQNIGRLTKEEFETGTALLEKAAKGQYTTRRAAADAGIHKLSGMLWGKHVSLRQDGDVDGTNSAPEAAQLADMIEQWCKQ